MSLLLSRVFTVSEEFVSLVFFELVGEIQSVVVVSHGDRFVNSVLDECFFNLVFHILLRRFGASSPLVKGIFGFLQTELVR